MDRVQAAGVWASQWAQSPIVEDVPCRGCLAHARDHGAGVERVLMGQRLAATEVRETPEGAYCVGCFLALPACPRCGHEPTSHAEYLCVRCELGTIVARCVAEGGRAASPTYRGWSTEYRGVGQDNGRRGRPREVERRG